MDLLDGQAAISSDRMSSVSVGELAGRKWSIFSISGSHPRFKVYRKLLRSGLGPSATRGYRQIHEDETRILLRGFADTPDKFMSHIKRSVDVIHA